MLLFHFFILDTYGEKCDTLFPGFQQRYNKFNDSVIFLFLLHSIIVSVSWSILWILRSSAK